MEDELVDRRLPVYVNTKCLVKYQSQHGNNSLKEAHWSQRQESAYTYVYRIYGG